MMNNLDNEIIEDDQIEEIKKLKQVFDDADEDGSGELDIDEFAEKIGPHLSGNLTKTQIRQLFMKIDVDAGGTIDWDEFSNFMLLQQSKLNNEENDRENRRLFPQDFRSKNDTIFHHKADIFNIYHFKENDKYITCGKDGTFRLWNTSDLRHIKTINNGNSWITSCIYMSDINKLILSAYDRSLSFYSMNRGGTLELSGKLNATSTMGTPLCLQTIKYAETQMLVYGDDKGTISLLMKGWDDNQVVTGRDMTTEDYHILHSDHTDWITQLRQIREYGLVSSSMDSTIKFFDLGKMMISHVCRHHNKGVYNFIWCEGYSLFASCGIERNILLWQGNNKRKIGELRGHNSSVTHIVMDNETNQLMSMAADKIIKLWDLRNNKCLQTILSTDWIQEEDSRPKCILYDQNRRQLVTTTNKVYIWHHHLISQDKSGHSEAVIGVLYNKIFDVVVSADEGGIICVWNPINGSRETRFKTCNGNGDKLTSIAFDKNERRLLTSSSEGIVKMWNFNNGSLLKEFVQDKGNNEITSVKFRSDKQRCINMVIATAWNNNIFIWEDETNNIVSEYTVLQGHNEDVLCIDIYEEKNMIVTGDYIGNIIIWLIQTGEKLMVIRNPEETSVETVLWLPLNHDKLVLSAGSNGILYIWNIFNNLKLICKLFNKRNIKSHISVIKKDIKSNYIIIGDSFGNLTLYDIRDGIDLSNSETIELSFKEINYWKAHDQMITSCDFIYKSEVVIITCSIDSHVSMWTIKGWLIGKFGYHNWILMDINTYDDKDGLKQIKPELNEIKYHGIKLNSQKCNHQDVISKYKYESERIIKDRKNKKKYNSDSDILSIHSKLKTYKLN